MVRYLPSLKEALGVQEPAQHKKEKHGVHACSLSTQESEAGGSEVQGHCVSHIGFEAILGYMRSPCHKIKEKE